MSKVPTNLTSSFDPMLALLAFRKRWILTAVVLAMAVCMSFAAAMQIKPKFESEASLFVRLGRESAGLDPTATTSEITPIYETREQELNSALEVMQSRKLLEAVLAVIGEDVILNPELFSYDEWRLSLESTSWPELDPLRQHRSNRTREKSIAALHKAISLEISQSSSVMGLASIAATPELAQAITQTMLDAFRTEHVRLNRTSGFEFFSEQVRVLQQKLDSARADVARRKNELGVMSIEGERARLEDELTALEKQIHTVLPDLSGAQASLKVYEEAIRSLPERTQPHDASDTLRKKLHELQQERLTLLSRFNEIHFRVQDVNRDIELLKSQLNDPANRNAANPTLRELEVALANQQALVAQLDAGIVELRRSQSKVRGSLTALNNAEAEMSRLKDCVSELSAAKVKATVKLEEARVLEQLSHERISNIQVVQPATFNPVSMSPSKTLVVLAGCAVGLTAALIIPAVIEFMVWYLNLLKTSRSEDQESALICG